MVITLTGSTIVTLQQNECGNNLKVEESATGSLDVANYTRASSVTVDRTPTDGTSETLSISTGESKSVAFRNVYTTNGGVQTMNRKQAFPMRNILREMKMVHMTSH